MSESGPSPRLTVGIPTRQRLPLLREAVASALAQRGLTREDEVEVLLSQDVFPDGRPDEPLRQWCRETAAANPGRVRHLLAERPLGLAGNWNAVVGAARGEFLVVIGDDDRLLPDFAATLLAQTGAADVAFSDHHIVDAAGTRDEATAEARTRQFARADLRPGPVEPAEPIIWRNAVPMLSAVVRVDLARRFPFHEDLNTPELEFFLRLARAGARFVYVPERLAEYRLHEAAATASGLWSDRLAARLLALPAGSPAAEGPKREFLRAILPNAVSRALERGDTGSARAFLRSEHYPPDAGGPSEWALRFCAALPGPLARSLRRFLCLLRDLRAGSPCF